MASVRAFGACLVRGHYRGSLTKTVLRVIIYQLIDNTVPTSVSFLPSITSDDVITHDEVVFGLRETFIDTNDPF